LELFLVFVAITFLLFTAVVTARVASNAVGPAEDLTFGGTLDELATLLRAGGRDRLAQLEHGKLSVGGHEVAVDTIAILQDPGIEPGIAKGGFIADQVALFNNYAIRRAVVTDLLGTSPSSEGTSLLRTIWTDDGQRRLSDRPSPFVLTVRSPDAERSWREVRTSDWERSGGILALEGDLPMGSGIQDGSRELLNGRDCTISRPDERLLVYCGSLIGKRVQRFFDVGFDVDTSGVLAHPTWIFSYRPQDAWRNGAKESFGRSEVLAGDIFDLPQLGPFVASVADRGTLAVGQWINGRRTFTNQRLGTISFFAAAGRSASSGSSAPLVLGFDEALSRDLEFEARRFLTLRAPALRKMSVLIMDLRTGELRALSEPARTGDDAPLMAFEPQLIGSVAKPLVAAAILARRPELSGFRVAYAGNAVHSIGGLPLKYPFANAANGCRGEIGFSDFLRCSSNQYAAELLFASLRADGFRPAQGDALVPRDVLERSSVADGLAEVFDVDAAGSRTTGRSAQLWTVTGGGVTSATAATSDATLRPWESRPWIVLKGAQGTSVDNLARYAFGGWNNNWTLMGVAEGYARIASSRAVHATIEAWPSRSDAVDAYEPAPSHVDSAFRMVRRGLRRVGVDGTARGLAGTFGDALPKGTVLLAKTGTLNERTDRVKVLALAVGDPASAKDSAALKCGLVVVSLFEFSGQPTNGQSLPAVHLEFARGPLANVLSRHWKRVSGCPNSVQGSR
jgi:hypothetical protein